MKIALGTAQLGLDYGIANKVGRVPLETVKDLIREATAWGIDTLDTAIAYGVSEESLGLTGVNGWNIVTKLGPLPHGCLDVSGWVEAQIEGSLTRLGIGQLHGVLLHSPIQLLGENGSQLSRALVHLKDQAITRKIGVSVYSPDELDRIERRIHLDLIQAPLSILDRRFVDTGWVHKAKKQGIELHIRSIFLQGLLLYTTARLPAQFSRWKALWTEWSRWLSETGLTPLQACLAYAIGIAEVDRIVVGVDSIAQLKEIVSTSGRELPSLPNWPLAIDEKLINPAYWSQL